MIAEFSLLLTFGMSLVWCLMPRAQVTSGFFRIQMLIVMGLGMLAILTMGQLSSPSGTRLSDSSILSARISTGIGLGCCYVGSILWLLERRSPATVCILCVMLSTLLSVISSRGGIAVVLTPTGGFHFLSGFATCAVLGTAVTGMLLGHWYLTAPTMSINPLKVVTWFLVVAVVLRLTVSAISWEISGQNLHSGVHWTWFALRWLSGIVGPLSISIMAIRILRYRNTQAATGVLFAGVILSFIGEMSAALLYSELHVPF